MSRVANTYWVDERIRAQRVAQRNTAALPSARTVSLEILGSRAEVRRRGGIIPSWVLFGMILVGTFAVCATVTVRTRAKLNFAADQFSRMQSDVERLRSSNEALRVEVERLGTDARTIETTARQRLNLVRPNEIVVPID